MSQRVAIFPGTFDPCTNGHCDIVRRARRLFDRVYIGIAGSKSRKTPLIPLVQRVALLNQLFADDTDIVVVTLSGLLVDWMSEHQVNTIVRGLRNGSDFDYEMQQVGMNNRLSPSAIDTVWLPAAPAHQMVASQFVREITSLKGDVRAFVPPIVADWLQGQSRE